MKTKDKFFTLLKEGFTLKTLRKMNESQLNILYKKVVKEQGVPEKVIDAAAASERLTNNLKKASEMLETDELTEDWGSSDQNIMNASIHRDLGEPEEMPSPFSPELESAAESAVDFYWDDWDEYQTDYEGLVDHAKRMYLRSYFPEKFSALVRMFEPVKDNDVDGELDEADIDNIKPFKGRQTQSPKQVGPSTDDGMNDYQDGMDIFEGKKKLSNKKPTKMKTPITTLGMFEGKKKSKYNPWAVCTDSLGLEGKKRDEYTKKQKEKFERCVRDVKKQNESFERKVGQIEESIVSLIKNYKKPTMTKKELLEQGTKEAPVKTPTKTPSKPERKSPYKPKHKPAPKAGDTKTAPTRVKPGTKEKPDKKNPYKPKHKPAPKAGGESDIPSFLKFDNLNITFRDE